VELIGQQLSFTAGARCPFSDPENACYNQGTNHPMHLPTFADIIEQIMLILQFTNTKISFDLLAAELAKAGWARPKCTLYTFMRSANRTASRHGRPLRFGYGNGFCWLDPLSKPVSNPAIIALFEPKRVGLRKLPPVVLLPCSDFPGRSFQLTHLDGDATGILKAQFTNSPIVCFYLPVDKIRNLSRTGDYMLLSDVGASVCRKSRPLFGYPFEVHLV
jgi:hypothetical protein